MPAVPVCEECYFAKKRAVLYVGNLDELKPARKVYDQIGFQSLATPGWFEALEKGTLLGNPIVAAHMVLQDGSYHVVDSFELATIAAFREI
ncbi:hypothetical protein V8E55_006752 [Tylopilus felleus]